MRPGARSRCSGASAPAAGPCTRWGRPSSSRRSSTSATPRATRYHWRAFAASTQAPTTRSMPTAELRRRRAAGATAQAAAARAARLPELPRRWAWAGLAVVLAGGLALRLWGIRAGLPYIYNADEADHFVPRAVRMSAHGLNPHYFAHPPGVSYLLHYVFAVAYGGKAGVEHAFALHPDHVYTLARVCAAALGAAAVWLCYLARARLLGRRVGLLAAALEAVALPPRVFSPAAGQHGPPPGPPPALPARR